MAKRMTRKQRERESRRVWQERLFYRDLYRIAKMSALLAERKETHT